MENRVDPWVRAELFIYDLQTYNLIEEQKRPAYLEVVSELSLASDGLQLANERYNKALEARMDFFK